MTASTWQAYGTVALAACIFALLVASSGRHAAVAAGVPVPALCETYSGLPDGFTQSRLAGMVHIPAGFVRLGTITGYPDERPTGEASRVAAFWMDRTEVTNAQFAAFVKATGYITDAEREGAAAVFRAPSRGQQSRRDGDWWEWRRGANWRLPHGPGSEATAHAFEQNSANASE